MFWVFELSSRIVLHTHYLVFLIANVNETSPVGVPSILDYERVSNTEDIDLKFASRLPRLVW